MPRSRATADQGGEPAQIRRDERQFSKTKGFDDAVDEFSVNKLGVLTKVATFEGEWKASASDADISPAFKLKPLNGERGQYRVWQIYAGQDYRAAVMILMGRVEAYWVHTWKKTKQNNREEVAKAKSRAHRLWEQLQRGGG